jgi:uncharacterized protein with HEPN domain
MSSRDDNEYLADIQESIRRINFYVANLDYDEFLDDLKTQDAISKLLVKQRKNCLNL